MGDRDPTANTGTGAAPRRTGLRSVYVLPNLFTCASLFSALASIIAAHDGQFLTACYLILLSAILDALDGPVARMTNSTSNFGLQLDSLVDLVAFGVAPAFLMFTKLEQIHSAAELPQYGNQMAIGVCALFAICAAIRLARFNVQADVEEKDHFLGLPTPAAAGVVVSSFMMVEGYAHLLGETRGLHRSILVLMIILAYLMVSTVPFPKLRTLFRRARGTMNGLVTAIFFLCLVVVFWRFLPEVVFLLFQAYLVASILRAVLRRRREGLGVFSPGTTITLDDEDDDPPNGRGA